MSDPIEALVKKYNFNKMLSERKDSIVSMVRYIFRMYEVFYGEPSPPPVDIIKEVIRIILEVSRECVYMRLSLNNKEIADRVVDRVVEKMFKIAEKELIKEGAIKYVS